MAHNAGLLLSPVCGTVGSLLSTLTNAAVLPASVVTPQMKTVLDYLAEYGEMNDDDLQELLNVKKTRAYLLARQMNENGLSEIVGRGVEKKYKLK